MIILGVDPGTATTGYGFLKYSGNKFTSICCGVIRTQSTLDMPTRLWQIQQQLRELIVTHNPGHMAVEELYFSKNTRTALSVGQARGVILLTGIKSNLIIGEYTPLQVKQAVAGYGRAEKIQVQKMVTTILGLDCIPKPDDAADAYAIAICHAHSYGFKSALPGEIR